jgi:hypothetical protein
MIMELKDTSYNGSDFPISVEAAVSKQIRPDPYDNSGKLETIDDKVDKLGELVARLVSMLAERRVFSAEEVCAVIGGNYGNFEPYKER